MQEDIAGKRYITLPALGRQVPLGAHVKAVKVAKATSPPGAFGARAAYKTIMRRERPALPLT